MSKALHEQYINQATDAELRTLADRAIGAAIRFAEYLDRNGEAWKKAYLARKKAEGLSEPATLQREVDSHAVQDRDTSH